MKNKFFHFFVKGDRFKKEFRRQLRMIIIVTLGFTIAFTWRQTIFDLSESIINFFINVQNPGLSSILTSTFITLVSIILIYLAAHFLKDTDNI